ncbi:MAG: protein kinase [Phycisphaerales bacterium]|nr:protein kinase [Phycisphaerales bacterium]
MDPSDPPAPCPDQVQIERLAAGEDVGEAVAEHVRGCATCQAVLAEIKERERFLDQFVSLPKTVSMHFGTADWGARDPEAEGRARSIGPYSLVSILGEGGFGQVWLAKRLDPFVQRVAIKVIKLGMDSAAVIARFEQERQALAMMDHPNIARVLDGGVAPEGGWGSGRPYFVMEYVDGAPITEYCDRRNLGTRERLQIFLAVCDAVEHAHMKGIIHRDLKPSNILVMDSDGRGVPKIIDFGIAKAIGGALTEKTIFTEQGQFIGTPEYMSPEQLELGPRDIDTRTDVYSLGVLLYELLAGARPFDVMRLRSAGFEEIRRIIREVDPPKPSARLTTMNDLDAGEIAHRRKTSRHTLARELKRELDWIPLMAMRKDRRKRYPSPGDLARDVRNYLEGRALRAGPESAGYLIGKVVRRHKVAFGAGGLALSGLVGGLVLALLGLQRERIARQEEYAQRVLAEESVVFLEDAIGAASPMLLSRERPRTLQEVINSALRKLESGGLARQPMTEARLRRVMGAAFLGIGNTDESVRQLRLAVDKQRSLPHGDPSALAQAEVLLADSLIEVNQAAEALALARALIDRRTSETGGVDVICGEAMLTVGCAEYQLGNLAEAEAELRKALALLRTVAPGSEQLGRTLEKLAVLMGELSRPGEADAFATEAIEVFRKLLGDSHPYVTTVMSNRARGMLARGELENAAALIDRVLRVERESNAGDPGIAMTLLLRASLELRRGQFDAAEATAKEAAALREAIKGGDPVDLAECLIWVGRAQRSAGRVKEAVESFERALELMRPYAMDHAFKFRVLLWDVGLARSAVGKNAEAERALQELEAYERNSGSGMLASVLSDRAGLLQRLKRPVEAAAAAEEALADPSLQGPRRTSALEVLGRARLSTGDLIGAESTLRELVEARSASEGAASVQTCVARALLGRCLYGLGRRDEGIALLRAAIDGMGDESARGHLRETIEWLAEGLEAAGKTDEAAEWRARAQGLGP